MIEHVQTNGDLNNDPSCIKEAFYSFYKGLFTSKFSDEKKMKLDQCLKFIPKNISCEDHTKKLDRSITLDEIKEAILSLANDKALGPHGIPIEFYKHNIGWIGLELLELYENAYHLVSLGADINEGVIKLLPKRGDKSEVKNWRPMTLLNLSYKIIAKILARHIGGAS